MEFARKFVSLFCLTSLLLAGTLCGHDSSTEKSGESVKAVPRSQVTKLANQIDALVSSKLEANGQSRNALSSDEIFLRRAYLDIAGRIPTIEEAKTFLKSRDKNKREKLIDQLLDSYGYVSRQYNFMADLLRIQSRVGNTSGQPYIDFVKDSLEANKPYDQLVRQLLTAEGANMSKENGAVGYYLRDYNMPEDNMSNTIRIFLGTRLECAQCHDHPFDKWTQRQYFEMVAFTGGMNFRLTIPNSDNAGEIQKLRRDRTVDQQTRNVLRRLLEPMTYGISGTGTGLARLPEGFMGDDGDEFDIVTAKTMFEGDELVSARAPSQSNSRRSSRGRRNPQQISGARSINSRDAYADWLTDSSNPRFAKVFTNRLWKQAMGIGLVEPVDIFEDGTVASNPELLDFLAETFVDLNYDMKQMLRIIYNTRTYQATAYSKDVVKASEFYFNGPLVRRMTAEQIWDSMLTMTVPDVDQRQGGTSGRLARYLGSGDIYESYDKLQKMSADDLLEMAESYGNGRSKGSMSMTDRRKMSQANSKMQQQRKSMATEIRKARQKGDTKKVRQLMEQMNSMSDKLRRSQGGNGMYRASEIQSPAPAGHFLREFGQSDRETIQNANTEPSVTQALSLMNGYIETRIARNPNTILMQNIYEASADDRIDSVYLTMLSRKPTRVEEAGWVKESKGQSGPQVVSDLIWTLANSNEFIFIK